MSELILLFIILVAGGLTYLAASYAWLNYIKPNLDSAFTNLGWSLPPEAQTIFNNTESVFLAWIYVVFFGALIIVLIRSYAASRRQYLLLLLLLSALLPVLPVSASTSYYREITITNNASVDLTDYQILLVFNTSNFDFGKIGGSNNFYFCLQDGTVLKHWVEEYVEGSSLKVWVRVPFIPAGGSTKIYMVYGGSVTGSSDTSTFDFYDGGMGWEYYETAPSYSGFQRNTLGRFTYYYYEISWPSGVETVSGSYAEIRKTVNLPNGKYRVIGWCWDSITGSNPYWRKKMLLEGSEAWMSYASGDQGWEKMQGIVEVADGELYIQLRLYISGTLADSPISVKFDDVYVAKYVDPEPTYSIGSENVRYEAQAVLDLSFVEEETLTPSSRNVYLDVWGVSGSKIYSGLYSGPISLSEQPSKIVLNGTRTVLASQLSKSVDPFGTALYTGSICVPADFSSLGQYVLYLTDYTGKFVPGGVLTVSRNGYIVEAKSIEASGAVAVWLLYGFGYDLTVSADGEERGMGQVVADEIQDKYITIGLAVEAVTPLAEKVNWSCIWDEAANSVTVTVSGEGPLDSVTFTFYRVGNGSLVLEHEYSAAGKSYVSYTYYPPDKGLRYVDIQVVNGSQTVTRRAMFGRSGGLERPSDAPDPLAGFLAVFGGRLPDDFQAIGAANILAYIAALGVLLTFSTFASMSLGLIGAGGVLFFLKTWLGGVTIADAIAAALMVMGGLYAVRKT